MGKETDKSVNLSIQEASKLKKDKEQIKTLMENYFNKEIENLDRIKTNTRLHDKGEDLKEDEYGATKIILKMIKRFCKTHASYVLKDMPNIKIPAKNEEVPESAMLASNVQKGVLLWWKEQSILRKLKRAVRKASYKGIMFFYLSNDKENKTITFNTLDPEFVAYDRLTADPSSPLLWFAKGEMINTDVLKKMFPKFEKGIESYSGSSFFATNQKLNMVFKDLVVENKAFYFEFFDSKYLYKFINDDLVETIEHNYPFIPFYVFPYFDLDSDEITSVVDFIREPAKMISQVFGYRVDFTAKHSDPPLAVTGKPGDIDPRKLKGGVIGVGEHGKAEYLTPNANAMDSERLLEVIKSFLHFLSGLSEEAMAGFTGSLTAAGVSIELRLDSTVREALDTQIILQDVLQKINRDYLKLMEQFYPSKNMLASDVLGVISDKKFECKMIAGLYNNVIDFGGILPRSQDQIVRNTITKYTTGVISRATALSEMNYSDPTLEEAKMKSEKIADGKLQKTIEAGLTPDEKFFATPEMENTYMFETSEMATPSPDQDHQYHIHVHEKAMEKLSPELRSMFALHIQMHKRMVEAINNK